MPKPWVLLSGAIFVLILVSFGLQKNSHFWEPNKAKFVNNSLLRGEEMQPMKIAFLFLIEDDKSRWLGWENWLKRKTGSAIIETYGIRLEHNVSSEVEAFDEDYKPPFIENENLHFCKCPWVKKSQCIDHLFTLAYRSSELPDFYIYVSTGAIPLQSLEFIITSLSSNPRGRLCFDSHVFDPRRHSDWFVINKEILRFLHGGSTPADDLSFFNWTVMPSFSVNLNTGGSFFLTDMELNIFKTLEIHLGIQGADRLINSGSSPPMKRNHKGLTWDYPPGFCPVFDPSFFHDHQELLPESPKIYNERSGDWPLLPQIIFESLSLDEVTALQQEGYWFLNGMTNTSALLF